MSALTLMMPAANDQTKKVFYDKTRGAGEYENRQPRSLWDVKEPRIAPLQAQVCGEEESSQPGSLWQREESASAQKSGEKEINQPGSFRNINELPVKKEEQVVLEQAQLTLCMDENNQPGSLWDDKESTKAENAQRKAEEKEPVVVPKQPQKVTNPKDSQLGSRNMNDSVSVSRQKLQLSPFQVRKGRKIVDSSLLVTKGYKPRHGLGQDHTRRYWSWSHRY